jgi:phosphoribosylformylglycinamidine synthase
LRIIKSSLFLEDSYGDDTGSVAYANKIKPSLELLKQFIDRINCNNNGCQIVTNLGLVPAFEKQYGERTVALTNNTSARFLTRWTDMQVTARTPWLAGIKTVSLPIAHGEGKFTTTLDNLQQLKKNHHIALKYIQGEISTALDLPANPNCSIDDIAGIIDETGRILALMPHPERGMFFTQFPHWTLLKEQYIGKENSCQKKDQDCDLYQCSEIFCL